MHIPLNELPDRLDELPGDVPVILFSNGPWRSSVGLAYLIAKGFDQVSVIPQGLPEMVKMLKPGPLYGAGVQLTDPPSPNPTGDRTPCNCST
ncbi:MAG: rhodanese-like domain-containing protein [Desulfobacterium sp.]|nr:rhodanese-like domain-containing protein [Desulfobacterium sp.]